MGAGGRVPVVTEGLELDGEGTCIQSHQGSLETVLRALLLAWG